MTDSGTVEFPATQLPVIMSSSSDLELTATVTDGTGRSENVTTVLSVYELHIRVQIVEEETTRVLHPGLRAVIAIRVTDQMGQPLQADSVVSVKVSAKNLQDEQRYIVIRSGETDGSLEYTPKKFDNPNALSSITAELKDDKRASSSMDVTSLYDLFNEAGIAISLAKSSVSF
ncbi:hypothetical protein PoB_001892100 [Plakobranchus ocellatus]|uniref:Macroglobulin domain-containing protein n=1 Tax=Plakobranchus ocellatus TaxID=259542 RepID=A0AAV3Z917_9GAST|nr:hypothetical protein PoB_001892100 [Plakobranchus ocellatus]